MYIDEVKKASAKAANAVPPTPNEVQKLRTTQEAKKKRELEKAKERSKIAALGRSFHPVMKLKTLITVTLEEVAHQVHQEEVEVAAN